MQVMEGHNGEDSVYHHEMEKITSFISYSLLTGA